MQQYWQQWQDKFAQLSQREKWLVALCGVVAFGLGIYVVLVEPILKNNQAVMKQITATKLDAQRLEADILLMTAKLKKDPDQELNLEFKRLMSESQSLSEQLAEIVENLISPSEMALLLEDVLSETKGLKLVALESMQAEPIVSNEQSEILSSYYLHPVRLEVTGNYFAIVEYLDTLENLPMKYYWRSFRYTVEAYPEARLVLEVYTLGSRQEFIGG
ncbi:type II secretion system protein GspM [Vibrio sp. Hep-1b-8]|uniref:type II secretion system protein GspM n=1 Tax=Vibrio sp. Hep-1b-8 TaxID=2144187 RepID=UPI00111091FD|nr:type II secretion system protein GspM [Vibrio sp. Hep-1b-8]TMX30795.1 MSHA biogenesis protein MshJ [Vibrio sp. Hep-1b-8]